MCVVKYKRSDKQTATAASGSGANECVSLECLQFSFIKRLLESDACLAYDSDSD